jgi:hypothetical protein
MRTLPSGIYVLFCAANIMSTASTYQQNALVGNLNAEQQPTNNVSIQFYSYVNQPYTQDSPLVHYAFTSTSTL